MRRRRILVVDDEPQMCEMVKAMLEHDMHTVLTATSATSALELLGRETFEVMITDYLMPGMKGDQLGAHVKHRYQIKVVMLSACPPTRPPREIDYIILKPFAPFNLRVALEAVFGPELQPK
ncbi:MAG TPA: response regulator [Candidatus Binatia bacterium]|nr:response regulator [Candidatus Binatia bacterium]